MPKIQLEMSFRGYQMIVMVFSRLVPCVTRTHF